MNQGELFWKITHQGITILIKRVIFIDLHVFNALLKEAKFPELIARNEMIFAFKFKRKCLPPSRPTAKKIKRRPAILPSQFIP